jgi:hypothetical protein
MMISSLADKFFKQIDEQFGPFDRPFLFRVFPFDAGGALNLLTVGARRESFVTYVTWDLFGHDEQKHGRLGRYELAAVCDDENWCIEILTKIGRQSLETVLNPGDTLDIGPWVDSSAVLQGIVFEEACSLRIRVGIHREQCGLLRCIGITRQELQYAKDNGVPSLIRLLQDAGIYPRTTINRSSVV